MVLRYTNIWKNIFLGMIFMSDLLKDNHYDLGWSLKSSNFQNWFTLMKLKTTIIEYIFVCVF